MEKDNSESMHFNASKFSDKGPARILDSEKRMFWRNPDDTKMYTHRFVRKLKAANKKVVQKFVVGTIYALKTQKKMMMQRARAFVKATHSKVEEVFKSEALVLLE